MTGLYSMAFFAYNDAKLALVIEPAADLGLDDLIAVADDACGGL